MSSKSPSKHRGNSASDCGFRGFASSSIGFLTESAANDKHACFGAGKTRYETDRSDGAFPSLVEQPFAAARPFPRLLCGALLAGLLLAGAPARPERPAGMPPGPTYESLRQATDVTKFLWIGSVDAPEPGEDPDAFLFVANDMSWLMIERGGAVSAVGPESWDEVPPRMDAPPEPLPRDVFEAVTGPEVDPFKEYCNSYRILRASLEEYWEARRLWRGRVSMEDHMYVDLFTAIDGRWAYVVYSPLLDDPQRQACMAMRGFYSRLFDQADPASQP